MKVDIKGSSLPLSFPTRGEGVQARSSTLACGRDAEQLSTVDAVHPEPFTLIPNRKRAAIWCRG
jgi:hypothetical protein